jgi:hypothetical protein
MFFLTFFFFYVVSIQFEEIDNVKTPLNLINTSIAPDLSAGPSDELIIFDPPETGLPTFQAHFPVSSPTLPSTTTMKKSDSNRGKFLLHCSLTILSINTAHHHHYKVLQGLYDTYLHAHKRNKYDV